MAQYNPYEITIFGRDPITIADESFDNSTTLTLPGRNQELYGKPIIQNWINMVQHFASNLPPTNAVPGQIWYNTASQELRLYRREVAGTLVWDNVLLKDNPTIAASFGSVTAAQITSTGPITVSEPTKLRVPGGTATQVLTTDGNSNLYWSTVTSGGGSNGVNGKDGKDGANGISVLTATVYTASNEDPNPPVQGTGSYSFATGALIPPVGSPATVEWDIAPPVTSTRVYGSSHTFTTPRTSPTATVQAGTWGPPFLAYATGRDGTNGAAAINGYNMSAFIRKAAGTPGTPQAGVTGAPSGSWNFTDPASSTPPIGSPSSTEVWSLNPPSGTDQLWVSYATATAPANAPAPIINTNNLVWSTPVQLAQTGTAGRDGLSIYNFPVYQDSPNEPPARPASGGSWDFGNDDGAPPAGWSLRPTGTRIWVSVAKAQIVGTTGIWTGTFGSWSVPVEFSGVPGKNGVVGYLTNESITLAADVNGIVSPEALSLATGQFKVFDGLTDVTASTTFAVVGSTNATLTINRSGTYSASEVTADTASATLRASYSGITIDKIFTISKSKTGLPGDKGTSALLVTLTSTAQAFTYTAGGTVANPAAQTITFTANLQNIQGTPTFTCTLYNDTGGALGTVTLGGSGITRTLSIAAFGAARYAVVTASIGGLSDTTTIVRLSDGAAGTNGINGVNGQTTVVGVIYASSTTKPLAITASNAAYNFATHVLTPPTAADVTWYSSIQPTWGGSSVWTSQASFVTLNNTATVANTTPWTEPVLAFSPGGPGPEGKRGFVPLGFVVTQLDPTSYTDAQLTAAFSAGREVGRTPPIGLGYPPIAGDAAQFYWKNTLIGPGNADVTIVRRYDGTVWQNIYQEVISGNVVATGSITATQMNTNSLYTLNIQSTNADWNLGDLDGAANSAGFWLSRTGNARFGDTLRIGNNLVVGNNATIGTGLTIGGLVTNGSLNANVVTSTQLTANSVTTDKIQANAVIATSIATGAVTAGKIDANAVTAGTIAANAVTAGTIAANAVTAGKIDANAVTAGKIDANAVTAGTIAAGAVTADKLSSTFIFTKDISGGGATFGDGGSGGYWMRGIDGAARFGGSVSIGSNLTVAGLITASGLNANTVSTDKIVADNVTVPKSIKYDPARGQGEVLFFDWNMPTAGKVVIWWDAIAGNLRNSNIYMCLNGRWGQIDSQNQTICVTDYYGVTSCYDEVVPVYGWTGPVIGQNYAGGAFNDNPSMHGFGDCPAGYNYVTITWFGSGDRIEQQRLSVLGAQR